MSTQAPVGAALSVARKELRALFQSPVAIIFLGIFLVAVLAMFLGWERFFARNLADVRPLFAWLPVLLIFLVSAVTMRSWAEERKSGTLEVLLTLPVHTRDLVLGKFGAGMGLVSLALLLTLPLPIGVSMLGPLDWGPVIGGYAGALLLASTYLAIGLCVSARTDNQVVALLLTLVVGGALYLIGSTQVVSLASQEQGELLRLLGSGARFESVERGVVDARDLVYYGSLTAFFLVLNGYFLEAPRLDQGSPSGSARAWALRATVGLVGLNAVAANVWLAPITALRVDLTESGEYSISSVTKNTLASLDEPLLIQGFFSERTHPALAPLVPQIRDLLAEYEVHGRGNVEVSFADPAEDEELEQEIAESYAIRSFPFGVTDRHSQAVVNSFFHILVRYGDQYEVLSFQDLIEVHSGEDLQVRLRNFEYDMTRAITKVSQEFQSLEALLGKLPEGSKVTAFITPQLLPADFNEAADIFRKVGADVQANSNGRVAYSEVDPAGNSELQTRLIEELGVQPLARDLFGQELFYLHLVLEAGDEVQRIMPRGDLTEADVRQSIEAAVKRATPGQLKSIAIVTENPTPPPPNPQLPPHMQPPPPRADYQALKQLLSEEYELVQTDLADGYVPPTVDVLIVGKTGVLTTEQQFAIDQYLMGGGSVVALAGRYKVTPGREGLQVKPADSSLFDLLATYGVTIPEALVMDPQNAPFPVPVTERRGMFNVQRIELLPYPLFPDIRRDGFETDHAMLATLNNVTLPWASPLALPEEPSEDLEVMALLSTSDGTWRNTTGSIDPDFRRFPNSGFGMPDAETETGSEVVAAALTGRFQSYFADLPNPLFSDGSNDGSGRTLKKSVADGRLIVVGTSEVVSDLMLQIAQQTTGEVHRSNLQMLQNAVDWSVEDTELLQIRTAGAFARTLDPMDEAARASVERVLAGSVLLPLLLVIGLPLLRRSRVRAIAVPTVVES